MGTQIGVVKLKGMLGGICFYESGGEWLTRVANGPSREKILWDSNFQRTRENNREFGGCAMAARDFRRTFAEERVFGDTYLNSRLTGIFKKMTACGDGVRGKRSIVLSRRRDMLSGFEFNKKLPLDSVFSASVDLENEADRMGACVTLNGIALTNLEKLPGVATHVVFHYALGVISDYVYDEGKECYRPTYGNHNGWHAATRSDYISIGEAWSQTLTLTATIRESEPLPDTVSLVGCLGVSFYDMKDGVYYPLETRAMKVVNVF